MKELAFVRPLLVTFVVLFFSLFAQGKKAIGGFCMRLLKAHRQTTLGAFPFLLVKIEDFKRLRRLIELLSLPLYAELSSA